MSSESNKTIRRPRGCHSHGQKNDEPPVKSAVQTPDHHPDVWRYRTNMTDKCLQEVAAAEDRTYRGVTIGSREYMGIAPVCDRSCGTKYHWCPTCFLAPRCDCMMPHFSSIGHPPNQAWYLDQVAAVKRFDHLPCDNRYWTMTVAIREIAFDHASKFCESCTYVIQSETNKIRMAHGRTYLELAHYLWKIVGNRICAGCVDMINQLECAHSKSKCPSTGAPLINSRLTNYESRKYGERAVQMPEPRKSIVEYDSNVNWSRGWSKEITKFGDSRKDGAIYWNESRQLTDVSLMLAKSETSPSSSPRKSFSIISRVVEAALDENAPMLLASQLMDLWFPESDDPPVGSDVSII